MGGKVSVRRGSGWEGEHVRRGSGWEGECEEG